MSKINPTDINKVAKETIERLTARNYFDEVKKIEQSIYDNKNSFNKAFYWSCQDKLNWINGEMRTAYGELKALLETFTAVRKVDLLQNKKCISVNGSIITLSREPGNDLLTEFVYSEITDLLSANILLISWLNRIESTITTCRNHIYGNGGIK